MDFPDYYDEVSARLMRVLDTVGLGEKVRWKRIEMWTQYEELLTTKYRSKNITTHCFGSQAEATTTWDLRSDIDLVQRFDSITVLKDLQSWEPGSQIVLVITDDTTPPGYVKLQAVYSDQPILIHNLRSYVPLLDCYGLSYLYSYKRVGNLDCTFHGPAITRQIDYFTSIDNVFALRDLSWPFIASEWIIRHREHNWPSPETVSIIRQSGTLLVPVGHQLSPERHLQWRISLSYGEKILVWQFNSTQYKCYVLLKMINKYFIKATVGDNVLTSYHCKTCMFYMIETTPAVLWQPQNLLLCIDMCLRKLCTWVEECNCPNYFIPAENMFLGKMDAPIQRKLANILHLLFSQKGTYLTMIPYEGIGQKLNIFCQSPITQSDYEKKNISESLALIIALTLNQIYQVWFHLLRNGVQTNPSLLERPSSSHGVRQTIGTILRRFCCSGLGSHLASKCLRQQPMDQEGLDIAYELLLLGSFSDVASGKLKLAALNLLQNNVILAENILQNIEENYTFLVSNVPKDTCKYLIMLRIANENLSITEVVRYYCAYPVPYLPSEMYCTPRVLIPEMFRSTGSFQDSLNPDLDYWQCWAVVDPKLYLHFLQHQCYHQRNKIPHKMAALGKMIWVIRHEELKYKDTALNLLAYCLKKDGLLVQSYAVLSMSMKLKNHHNAAKWQIACLINAAFRWLGGRR